MTYYIAALNVVGRCCSDSETHLVFPISESIKQVTHVVIRSTKTTQFCGSFLVPNRCDISGTGQPFNNSFTGPCPLTVLPRDCQRLRGGKATKGCIRERSRPVR